MKRPSVEQWRIFVKSSECRSFSKAARALNTDPSYVAKAVGKLELYLGRELFFRTHEGLKTTWFGEKYLTEINQTLKELDLLFTSTLGNQGDCYRIGVPHSLLDLILHWISDFQKDSCHKIKFEVSSYESGRTIDTRLYDLAIVQKKLPLERAFVNFLGRNIHIIIASEETASLIFVEKPEDLQLISLVSSKTQQVLTNGNIRIVIPIKSAIKVEDSISAMECAFYGKYCSVGVPVWAAWPYLQTHKLVRILPSWECEPEPLWIVRPNRLFRDEIHRTLTDYLIERWSNLENVILRTETAH